MVPHQYMLGNPSLPPAFYGLQQPQAQAQAAASMYAAAYTGLEDLAALHQQRSLHTLVGAATAAAGQQQQQAAAAAAAAAKNHAAGVKKEKKVLSSF